MPGSDLKKLQFLQDTTEMSILQDTILPVIFQDTIISGPGQDSISITGDSLTTRPLSPAEIQLLFDQSDRHQKTVDSFSRSSPGPVFVPSRDMNPGLMSTLDTGHIIFSPGHPDSALLPEFILDIPDYSYREQVWSDPVFIENASEALQEGVPLKDLTATQTGSKKELVEKEITTFSNDWILGVVLVSFVILAWIRLFYNKFLSPTFLAVINQQVSYNLHRDKSAISSRVSMGLNLIFYINTGLYAYLASVYLDYNISGVSGFWTFVLMCLLLVAIFISKNILATLVGVISLTQKTYAEYMHNVFLFNRNLGLALFPVILGMAYMSDRLLPIFFYSGIVCVIAAYFLKLFRGFQIFIKEGVSIFYWILYLCALEFLPVLLFFKLSGLLVW